MSDNKILFDIFDEYLTERGITLIIVDYKRQLELMKCSTCGEYFEDACINCTKYRGSYVCLKCCKSNVYNTFFFNGVSN